MKRTVVIGTSGSGKTTLARKVAELLDIPHIELDTLHWLPNWQERPDEEFRKLTREAAAQEFWVADGNYSRVRAILWGRATAVIWLNYSFLTIFRRVLWRTLRRALTREELFADNRESFRMSFLSRDSIILWMITSFHRNRRKYRRLLFDENAFPHLHVIELTQPRQAEELLGSLKTSS